MLHDIIGHMRYTASDFLIRVTLTLVCQITNFTRYTVYLDHLIVTRGVPL